MNEAVLKKPPTFRYGSTRSHSGPMHSHHYHDDRFEIYYMVSGKCRYFINDKSYEISPGDVVLIPEGVIHKTDYNGEEHIRILIECSAHFIPEDMRQDIENIGYLYRNLTVSRDIHNRLKAIEEDCKISDEYTHEILKANMRLLFVVMLRNKNSVGGSTEKNTMVENVVAYIKEHYHTDITLGAVAKANFVSAEHLCRTFKKHTGFGFNEFLTLVRLQQAENLLKRREGRSISEIAYSCGFNDSNYFSDKFRRVYGTSPLRYSKEHKEG